MFLAELVGRGFLESFVQLGDSVLQRLVGLEQERLVPEPAEQEHGVPVEGQWDVKAACSTWGDNPHRYSKDNLGFGALEAVVVCQAMELQKQNRHAF